MAVQFNSEQDGKEDYRIEQYRGVQDRIQQQERTGQESAGQFNSEQDSVGEYRTVQEGAG